MVETSELEALFLSQIQQLCPPQTPLVVGVSGGADSMALMTLLVNIRDRWPLELIPIHVDHGLRDDSAEDAHFVSQTLRDRFQLAVIVERIHIAPVKGESIEMAARRQRYEVLERSRRHHGLSSRIAVGHHRRDQAETVLMRIITGTGVHGLQGMPASNGTIIRPLLSIGPDALRAYLRDNQLSWREDATNQDPAFLRNRIRLELLPLLQSRFNPEIEEALAQLARRAQETYQLVHEQAVAFLTSMSQDTAGNSVCLPQEFGVLNKVVQADILDTVARGWGLHLNRIHIEKAIRGQANWPEGTRVKRDAEGRWMIDRRVLPTGACVIWHVKLLPEEGTLELEPGSRLHVYSSVFVTPQPGMVHINRKRWPRLAVRPWRHGDRIEPLGMKGHHKKVGDIFTDYKIPRKWRQSWPVIVDAEDHRVILGIAGIMSAEKSRCEYHNPCTVIAYDTDKT